MQWAGSIFLSTIIFPHLLALSFVIYSLRIIYRFSFYVTVDYIPPTKQYQLYLNYTKYFSFHFTFIIIISSSDFI